MSMKQAMFAILMLALAAGARADERMNGMVGLWYGPYNGYSFEYDLIAQFFKSQEWMGNITGPYLADEAGSESNRFGIGFVTGKRVNERGTFAVSATFFEQNRWGRFSHADWGAEAKMSLFVFGVKLGLTEDWEKLYWQAGLSY
jgi:hypothetical protein